MQKKGELFLLIKSLTKSEKRYFKVNSARDSQNYLALFDFIEQQQKYDEREVKEYFKGKKFINQLHVTKNYLYQMILKCLRNYHAKKSKEAELKDLLKNIEVLFYKELFDACHYAIQKAEKFARKYEIYHHLLEVLGWKRRLIHSTQDPYTYQEKIVAIAQEEQNVLDILANHNQFTQLSFQITAARTNLKLFMQHPLLQHLQQAKSLKAKLLFYYIHYLHQSIFQQDYKTAEDTLQQGLTLWEENCFLIAENPGSYITWLHNQAGLYLKIKQTEKIPPLLHKIKQIPSHYTLNSSHAIVAKFHLKTYNLELEFYRDTQQWDKGLKRIPQARAFLEKYHHHLPKDSHILLYYQFAYIFFKKKEFSRALGCLNKLLDYRQEGVREDIQLFGRFLYLIIHFELGVFREKILFFFEHFFCSLEKLLTQLWIFYNMY